ncbi:MAG: DEAD/DEAH box helicase [Clostridiales bacterium]|jgi:non-specific serine/threonine protein kinase|nr:DEAD/DEAH box helicase [Clostridiales bacterium]
MAPTAKPIAIYTQNGFYVDKAPLEKGDDAQFQARLYEELAASPFETLYGRAFLHKGGCDVSIQFLIEIAAKVISDISRDPDADTRRAAAEPGSETLLELLRAVPFVTGCEFVNLLWISKVYQNISAVFTAEFSDYSGSAEEYFKSKNAEINVAGKVYFHLVENKDESYPFAFLATYSSGDKNNVTHLPLKNALEQRKSQDELLSLLSAVSRAADKSEFVSELIESGELFLPLKLTAKEAYTFLKETPVYEECGVLCRVPNFWKRRQNTRLRVSVGAKEPAAVGLEALVAFSPEIYLGDESFTREEIEALLSETRGLAFLKGKWVELDQEKLRSILAAFDNLTGQELSLADAIRMQSGLSGPAETEPDTEIEITNGQWLELLREQMVHPEKISPQDIPGTFHAILRHYQHVGFNWLNFMIKARFGALLADDMGLGKTVQILALLDLLRNSGVKALLIIPASLIQNWRKETEKFAPGLRLKILHKDGGRVSGGIDFDLEEADLFITTYGMAMRIEKLTAITWDLIILDEAQAIKNHVNKQTKAVKSLTAKGKIAMTGTPVENRLADLWSIFDFLNKGLLGSQKDFDAFAKSLKDNTAGYEKLRRVVNPFILRRLKTDKTIISDLPDKVETKQYTTLGKKQAALYNQLVNELRHAWQSNAAEMPPVQRRGVILASIMKFKQICNHPDQYLGTGEFSKKHSGKFETLEEICQTIRDKRERVLVFTQFKEMTKPIADFLTAVFEREGLILHGETPVKKRGELVDRFNAEEYVPFMVLSLKAGGVGLNLTSANHVIHFDRWWNPAIENQATDRAFRIGQQKNVMVYKFITTGTIEEKIDTMIEGKQKLANDVIMASAGENWITEMSDEELFNLFKLEV